MRCLGLVVGAVLLASHVAAAEKVQLCAKYRTEFSWSKGYKVEATVLKGSELNSATSSFRYNGFATYVVIFWDEGEATVIELDFGVLGAVPQKGEDQEGRQWQVSKGSLCF